MTNDNDIIPLVDQARRLLEQIRSLLNGDGGFPKEKLAAAKQGKCLVCGKKIPDAQLGRYRGCDQACYQRVKRQIAKGNTTDQAAVAAGYLLPAQPGGRPNTDDSFEAFIRKQSTDYLANEAAKKARPKKQRTKKP